MPDFGRWTANGGDPSLNDINRADRFLDALAGEQPVYSTDRGDAELAALLSGWRDEVRHVPMDHVVSPSQATAALVDATNRPRGRNRFGLAVVGSAAAAVLCLGGFGTAVFAAGPGDGLYGVRTMIFGEERATRDDAVVLAAQTELAQVQQLVEKGQWDQAQEKLAALSSTVQSVGPVEQKQDLIQQWNALTYKVVAQNPAATLPPPGEPMPVLPPSPLTLLPVPVIEETLTTTPGPEVLATTTTETTGTTTATTTTGTTTETSPSGTSSTETSPATTSPSAGSTSEPATSPSDAATTSQAPSSAPTTTAPSLSSTTSAPAATTTTAPSTTTTTTVAPTTSTTVAPPATSAAPEPQQEAPAQSPEPAVTTELEQSTSAVVTTTTTAPVGAGE
ncbi:Anti-sigma-D factor RsdA to sigma factor binding region [Mycolicibacterium neoaurum]|uniref:anti-sigma-D factor RsdA n=1 Tax=Mycolicibacterium neoaurum TaxID=1795 RepID=UPI000563E3FD|nr:anti-sigma-D factor RsdA [Mycolicibacterium neoaurum]SDC89840.1 Anti-sigma-D factor RsdA to sigma factor binding region [Mycolicibacterium neoaurum]